jgi:hypothetical protein
MTKANIQPNMQAKPQPVTSPLTLHIHIGRMSVEGRSAADARRIAGAMERRMTELANRAPSRLNRHGATQPAANQPAAIEGIDAGVMPADAGLDAIGTRIANELFRKLGATRHA